MRVQVQKKAHAHHVDLRGRDELEAWDVFLLGQHHKVDSVGVRITVDRCNPDHGRLGKRGRGHEVHRLNGDSTPQNLFVQADEEVVHALLGVLQGKEGP